MNPNNLAKLVRCALHEARATRSTIMIGRGDPMPALCNDCSAEVSDRDPNALRRFEEAARAGLEREAYLAIAPLGL